MKVKRIVRMSIFLSALLMAILMPYVASAATTWTVCAGGGCDYTEIQTAIANANTIAGDTVLVSAGTYNITSPIDFLGKAITVKSASGAATTIIDANQTNSVVSFTNSETATSVLDGFTITDGQANPSTLNYGGGIYIDDASPTIKNCIITQNASINSGGGIYLDGGSPTITNCTISQNESPTGGGGGLSLFNGSPTITNCTITENGNLINNALGGGMLILAALQLKLLTVQ
ncbi:hypothetical protein ACFL2A_00270 [Thermodesulfobacteriota bacterium]